MTTHRTRLGRITVPFPTYALVVPVLAGLGGVAFFVWKPGVARSLLGSPRALAFTVVVGMLVLGAGWLLPRLGRGVLLTTAVQMLPVIAAFVLTVLPAFRQVTVVEAFPASVAPSRSGPAAPSTTTGSDGSDGSDSSDGSDTTEPAARASVVGTAELSGIDHEATGTVLLVRRADGSHVVRLTGLDVEAGPDYFVHLVPGAGQEDPQGGARLDALRGNKGDQNYDVPADVEVVSPLTVLIWCRAFAVPVAAATIR